MWSKNQLTQQLNIAYPIIQGPMAGASPPALVSAVSNAGGLGSLGAALMTPAQIRDAIKEIRARTDKPFAVNLFVPAAIPMPSAAIIEKANNALNPIRRELNIPQSPEFKLPQLAFAEQLAVVLEEKVPVFSFTFGFLGQEIIQQLKKSNIVIIGTATTVREAILLQKSGVDFIVAQGSEAGGHRGSAVDTPIETALIGSVALIPQIVEQVNVPVIAAGGVMNGRAIVAALNLGASAVQMGTAFLTCPEAGIHAKYRETLLNSTDENTCITRAFSGRSARGIKNKFVTLMAEKGVEILPYPFQRAITRDIVVAAAQQNNPDFMMMWSGQAAKLCRAVTAKILMAELVAEVKKMIN